MTLFACFPSHFDTGQDFRFTLWIIIKINIAYAVIFWKRHLHKIDWLSSEKSTGWKVKRPVLSFCIFGSHGLCVRWQLAIENPPKKGKGLELVDTFCNRSHFPIFPFLQHNTGAGRGVRHHQYRNWEGKLRQVGGFYHCFSGRKVLSSTSLDCSRL